MKFTKDMTIEQALETDPRAIQVFANHGMACFACSGALMESIEAGAKAHGIDTDKLLEELNSLDDKQSD
ncbi:MAG: DUF1858 domain-containing protein [Actinobacteria bacterium]|nr:MAG: DUF1858 domain-containing protein [Actinomycetota bacterium]